MDSSHRIFGQRGALACAVTLGCLCLLWAYAAGAHADDREPPQPGGTGSELIAPAAARGGPVASPQVACPPEEITVLGMAVPVYIHWHLLRHVQWKEDEVIDPILEAIAKEEQGQQGAAEGRGPVFRLMLTVLQAADPAKAELVQSGLRAGVLRGQLRAGAAGRTQEVARLARDFAPQLTCLLRYRKAIEYLTVLNQMPYFPEPIVDPEGDIGQFIGAYMRKHIIVDHDVITRGILTAGLYAHKALKPAASRSAHRAASLALLEKVLEKLDPRMAALARQGQGAKALQEFLDAHAALSTRQARAMKEYEESYTMLPTASQEALRALAPPPSSARQPPRSEPSQEPRGVAEGEGSTAAARPEAPPASAPATSTEKRFALVLGNGGYAEAPLRNPINDARAMEQSLRDVGFEVVLRENLTKRAMEDEIRAFGKRLKAGGVGLFYFAGHGLQVNGANYLVPIGSALEKEQDVVYEAVDAGRVVSEMEAAENRLNIVILDACRNNPLTRSFRSAVNGLAAMNAPSGTLIAYATAPGSVANDGDGRHGLYTQELLQQMRRPGLKLEDLFKRVRVAVKAKSQGKQLPWETSALEGDFFFVKPYPPGAATRPEQHVVAGDHPMAAAAPAAAAEQHAAVPPVEAPDRPQAVAPPPAHVKPEDSRVDTANRLPPVGVLARPQEGEPQQRPSGQRPRSSKVAQVLRRAAQRAKQQKPSAMTSQEPRGGAGWKIITK